MNENEIIIENLQKRFEIASKFKTTEFYLKAEGEYFIELCHFDGLSSIANKMVSRKMVPLQVFAHYVVVSTLARQIDIIKFDDLNNENVNERLDFDTPLWPEDEVIKKVVIKQVLENLQNLLKEEHKRKVENRPWPTPEEDMESERDEIELHDLYTFHTAIVKCLREVNNGSHFNSEKSIVSVISRPIVVSRTKDSNPHNLLKTIFSDKKKLWNYDEIADNWGWPEDKFDKKSWRTFYNACISTNSIVEKKTGIEDFLIFDSKTARINTKYL